MHAKPKQAGFTTIEIVFLLVVIGVLSWLILATRQSINQKQDNNERQQDINELRLALETYYSEHSKYPTLVQMNDSIWRGRNLRHFDRESLRDPASIAYKLTGKPTPKMYAYVPVSASGRACDDIKVICTQYTLTATLAGGGVYIEHSLE